MVWGFYQSPMANEQEGSKLKAILGEYEVASGQAINMAKSEIYFSRNTSEEVRTLVTSLLGVTKCLGTGKYLGLPSMVGRSKKQVFAYLRDRMWKRIHHWSGKHLSKAGKEVLVKSVAQSIPTYCMSAFLIPTTLGEELERMINSFWWGGNNSQRRGIKWLNWEKLTMRKEHGGLGFRHFYGFNLALLGKQAWHIANDADTIVGRVFKAKYFPKEDFLGARLGHNPSYVWRSIHSSQAIVKLGMRWRIGSGERVSVWKDPWLRDKEDPWVKTSMVMGMEDLCVNDLMNVERNAWNTHLIQQLFQPADVNRIVRVPILDPDGVDEVFWWRSRSGRYSVRSAYYGAMEDLIDNSHLRIQGAWMLIWKLKIPQKIKLLLWRVARGCLPTRSNLSRRHVPCEVTCPMCGDGVEDEKHVFLSCPQVAEIWQQSGLYSQVLSALSYSEYFNAVFFHLLEVLSGTQKYDFAMMFWVIWKRRNEKVWEGITKPITVAVQHALDYLQQWTVARKSGAAVQEIAVSAALPRVVAHSAGASSSGGSNSALQWMKPVAGVLKCNIDATIFADENKYGIGICVRDDRGLYRGAKTMWFDGSPSPQEAEAMGLLQALHFTKAKNFNNVVIEMDCQSLVNGINNNLSLNNEVPEYSSLRRNLLHLAPRLANLPKEVKDDLEDPNSRYNFGWSHGKETLESGKADLLKGSFYANPLLDTPTTDKSLLQRYPSYCGSNIWPRSSLPELELAFKALGKRIFDVGLMLAYHCDQYVSKKMKIHKDEDLESILNRSRCHKGRLLYYFPAQQGIPGGNYMSSWCGWHTDNGSLTGLTCAIFTRDGVEIPCPDSAAGLYIRTRNDQIVKVVFGVEDIAYQIGETAEILSGGILRATPHCVQAPKGEESSGVERSTFALFMQPDWDEKLSFPEEVPIHKELIPSNASLTYGEYSEMLLDKYYDKKPA